MSMRKMLINHWILGMQSHQNLGFLPFGQQGCSGGMVTAYLPPDQAQKGPAWLINVSQFLTVFPVEMATKQGIPAIHGYTSF